MGMSSGSNIHQQSSPNMLPPRQPPRAAGLHASLFLTSSDARGSSDPLDPKSNFNQVQESPAESASSRETWPTADAIKAKKLEHERADNGLPELSITHRVANLDKISLRNIARERVDIISEKMHLLPEELLEELKGRLRLILEGSGGSQHREEFFILQNLVQSRSDLTAKTLIRAHRVQLEILVAINTGIQAFLHPTISLSQTSLIEVFVYKRCRNIACQSQLPADDCSCEICTNRKGFCNLCMCVICNKFDFEVNTCRWIGCDSCSHWTHTNCAIHEKQIGMGPSKSGAVPTEMLFRCWACKRTSELFGWVKDVFQHCALTWDREALIRELDFVSRIFEGSEDSTGRKLYWKCEELKDELNGGAAESIACRVILMFFQELDMHSSKNPESGEGGRAVAPQEVCNRIAEVVQEAVKKMELVADEKMRMFKKARQALDACEHELKEKAREVAEVELERQQKKQQINELESIARLKQAEADMFQIKADEARWEAERLQRISLAKAEKSEEDFSSRYLKLRLSEAEAEQQYIFQKIKLQESSRASQSEGDPSQVLFSNKNQELLKNVFSISPKAERQTGEQLPIRMIP